MTPQSSQRALGQDHLDEAIDHVAQRLTHVDEDAQFKARIIAALPERVTWFGWLTHSWAPRLAMMAIVAGALTFSSIALPRSAGRRHTTEVSPAVKPLASVVDSNWPELVAAIPREPLAPNRTVPLEPLEPMEPMEPVEPFDGLPSLQVEGSLAVSSIVIADLPLTVESFPQREE